MFSLPANVKFSHSRNFKDYQEHKLIGEDFLASQKIHTISMSLRNSRAGLLFGSVEAG